MGHLTRRTDSGSSEPIPTNLTMAHPKKILYGPKFLTRYKTRVGHMLFFLIQNQKSQTRPEKLGFADLATYQVRHMTKNDPISLT